jgi:hypothetical protein
MKVHHAIGNHDAFGVFPKSGFGIGDAGFGKQMSAHPHRAGQSDLGVA